MGLMENLRGGFNIRNVMNEEEERHRQEAEVKSIRSQMEIDDS